jgi:nucleoside-diphosphate-sugar epimerase
MTRSTVLVLGAAGRLGAAAVQAFSHAGWRVLAQQRRAPAQFLPRGCEHFDTPLADTAELVRRAAGAAAVVYAVNPPYDRWDSELLPLARQGMDAAEALGARFMLPGNVYNFGPGMPALLRTDTPQPGGTAKGRQRCALEAEMRKRAARGPMQATVIRAGDFFGGGSGNWFDQAIVKDIRRGRLVYPGPLDRAHAWAYLPDLARAFVAAAAARVTAPAFETLHFGGHTFTGAELLAGIEAAAGELGLQPARGWRHGGLPWGVIRTIGLVRPVWRELARMRYLWQVPHALDGSSLAQAVGPLPQTPPALALRLALGSLQAPALATRAATA